MSNPFDQFDGADSEASNPFDQFDSSSKPKKQNKGIAGDIATDLKRGIEQLPGIATGLADIPIAAVTGEAYANKLSNALGGITGFKPSQWSKDAEAEYSPGRQAAKANVDQAWEQNQSPFKDAASGDLSGIGNIAKAYIQNPQQLIGSVAESLPSMAAGGVAGRVAMGLGARGLGAAAGGVGPELPGILSRTIGEKLAPVIAGSGGEGAVMAGQQMDQLSNTDADPRAAAGASLLTGVGGAAIGALGGKVAQKMGVIDPDTAMASGIMRGVNSEAGDQTIKGAIKDGAKSMAGGAVSEGLFEELPQSVLEQVLSNLAQSKPWDDGVSRAAVEGTLAGGLMGGAFNAIPPTKQEAKQNTPPVDPAQQNPLLALPAPTYTGTPGGQLVQADAERQAAIDKAQAEADALYAARDEYERTQAGYRQQAKPTIITDPEPIQQRIDALMGINEARLQGFARTNYEKALENAFAEQIGFVAGKDSIEIPFTMGDYLKSKVAAADIGRKGQTKQAAPAIPVVGPLSAVANAAVQSGAHQATVMQQAAAQATQNEPQPEGKAGTPAGAQKVATAPASARLEPGQTWRKGKSSYVIKSVSEDGKLGVADFGRGETTTVNLDAEIANGWAAESSAPSKGPLTEVANAVAPNISPVAPNISAQAPNIEGKPNAANAAPVAKEAPKENAPQVGAAPAKAEGASGSTGQAFIASRTDVQLNWLAEKGKGENKDLAKAELQRRRGESASPQAMPSGVGYEQRSASRVLRINKAKTQKEFDAITAEEHSDGERHFEGTERVRSAIDDRKFALKIEAAKSDEASRYEAGEWVSVSEHGSRSAAEQESEDLQRKDPSSEYGLSIGQNDGWSVRKRKKPEAAPVKSEQPQPMNGAENWQAKAEVLTQPGAVKDAAPAADSNGFVHGQNGYKTRIAQHKAGSNLLDPTADVGAFTYEVRKGDNDPNPMNMAINKDGNLVPTSRVLGKDGKSNGTAWVPANQEDAEKVRSLLEQRAKTEIGSTERKAIDAQIKEVVTGNSNGGTGSTEPADQNPIKNASPTAATVSAETVAPNQEPIKKDEQPKNASDRLRSGEINVEQFMEATGLTDEDVGFLTSNDLNQKADNAAKEESPYFAAIKKLSAAIFKEMEGLSRGSTAPSRRAYDANLAKYKAAQDTLNVIAKNFEHPFRNTLIAKLPPFLESRYGKQWDGIEYGDKAKKAYRKDSYRKWVDLLIEAARNKNVTVDAVSQPKTDAAPEAAVDYNGDSKEVGRMVGRLYSAFHNSPKGTGDGFNPISIDDISAAIEEAKKVGITVSKRTDTSYSAVWDISTPAGNEYLAYLSPEGRGTWKSFADNAKAAPEAKQEQAPAIAAESSQSANSEPDTNTRFSKNTIFTADKVAAAKARMKAKLGTMNSGIDPELLIDGMTVAGAYIEAGVRKFSDYAKAMVEDLGDGVKPYLLSFYEAARAYPGLNKMGMDSAESAASQHQALLTPAVLEKAKDVVGESPKVEKKRPANLGESLKLKQDWGVKNIDGYTRSKTGKNQETDAGLSGGIKDEFLADATRYLKQVEKLLAAQGFTAQSDSKGKPFKTVSTGEGGPAVGGDVYLRMSKGGFEVFAQVGVTNIRGIGPSHPQGVSLMTRAGERNGMNNWLATDLSAGDLSAWFDKQYQAFERRTARVDIPAASTTLEVKNEQSAPELAPAIGEANNGTATSKQGDPVLEGLASETVQGTAGGEPTGDGSGGGGGGSSQGNQGTDAVRGATGRSGGSGAAEVDTATPGGTGPGRAGLGNNGTGRPGSGVSAPASKPSPRGKGRESSVPAVAASDIPAIPEANFEITEDVALGSGGQMTKYRDNIAAIKVLKTLESERRRATAAEKKLLARYVGWGGIANAFRNGVTGQVAKDWESEVSELEALLTPKELRAASASTRNAHYTAKEVVDFMWGAVKKMGFDGGLVLEPSVGTGNFIGLMPKEFAGKSFVTGVELDSLTARIASALYPKSSIVNTGFQKAALPSNRFRLAIGNPPFGSESLRFQFRPELNNASIHNQFFLGSMDSLEPGGIMTMVVSRYLLDAKDASSREKLAIDAKLMGAVRLPGSAFKGNALTEVVTDVLFFRKRDLAEAQLLREAYFKRGKPIKGKDAKVINELQAEQNSLEAELRWTKTGEMKDPLGGEPMVISQYFVDRPNMVIGTMDRSGSMRQGGDIEVSLPKGEKLGDRLSAMLERMSVLPAQSMTADALANAEKFHKAMGESLKLSATGAEADAITFDEDGDLSTVIERVGAGGETALSPLKISPATPWSAQLQMDMDGKWFREVTPKDKAGNSLKVLDANGNPTKRNQYVREVFKKESDIPKSLLLGETKYAKMKDLISIRDLFVNQIDLEVSRATPEQMEANRAELRNAYKAFTDKYGFISDQKNASIISDMPDEGLLMSLELSYKPEVTAAKAASTGMPAAPASAKPAAILSRPVAIPPADKTSAESAVDGLAISLSETGRIDIARIAELRGLSEEAAMEELIGGDSPMAFKDPENGNELTEKNAYLSGNVRRKLEAAKLANMTANVKALEAVQPEPWSSDKVTARVGANWIPADTYGEFLSNLLGDKASVKYSKLTNTFEVRGKTDGAAATATWGTKRVSAVDLMQDILNSRSTRVVDRGPEGQAIFNQVETDAANDKRKEIVEAFNEWIFKDPDRRAALTQQFNDTFNTRVTPQYDGSHLAFPGKVPDEIIALRRGQVNAVWRGIIEDAVLYDHAVGAGKTFTGIARAMERRRMGMSKKPMVVVPNHMVGEWAAQAYRLYPGARVLAATKKDLESKNRRRLFAKIASGDWDMVIVPHSSFQFISISPETEERLLMEELAIANAALKDAEEQAEPGSRFKPLSVKAAEALIEKIEKRLDAARGRLGKDKLLNFEQMGVDDLTIDEAHEFKNLFYSSNLTDVRGMGNKTGSDKAFDLYSKTRVIREVGGSLAFLTGTPISNSAVEAYNILRYLAPESLKESGLEHFDAFRSQYVDATAKFEPTDSGGGLKLVARLGRSWSNMRSLMELYYSVADVVTNDDIKRWYAEDNPGKEFPLPKVKSGDRIPVSVDATPTQMRLLQDTIAAFDGLDGIEDIKERNAERLRLMDRARKLSLHARAVDPTLDDEPGGKLDKVADKASEIYRKSMADKGTQLIFLDRGVPKAKGDDKIIKEYDDLTAKLRQASLANNEEEARKLVSRLDKFDANEIEELRAAQNSNWSGYQHIKDRLIEQGVPANEIAFVQDFNGDAAKEQLFQAVRDGAIRILIGSTPRMGAGTNVQERLVALHHVDATWKPSDIEQREGRIIRQGNALLEKYGKDFEVEIYAYVTKRTVDAKLWDLNATKLRMINAIRYYDGQFEMDFDDEAAVGMAEIAAIASGDPLLLERFKLSTEIDNLYRQKSSHRRRVESADDSLRSAKRLVENAPKEMAESKEDAALRDEFSKAVKEDTKAREVTMAGKRYSFEDAAQLKMDYTKFVDGIGEDEKFSLVVDGKEYTSDTAAKDAINAAIGDIEPFVAEVDGKTFNRRSDYARAIREKIGDELAPEQEIPATAMGTIGGIPVSVEVTNKWGSASIYLGLTGKYESTGRRRSVVGQRYLAPEKHKKGDPYPLSVNALRPVISDFEKSIGYLWDGSDRIKEKAEKAEKEIPAFEAQIAEKFKGQDELDEKTGRLATVEAELAGRKTDEDAQKDAPAEEGAGNVASSGKLTPADKAIYGMAAEGKSAKEILGFIAGASRNPFYRQVARLLLKTGIAPSITVGDSKTWNIRDAKSGEAFAAAYDPKTNTVALFRPASAERNALHELIHAASLKALAKNGLASAQMKALFAHVEKTGKLNGMYGIRNVDEFIAEAFSNPKFQAALKQVSAAPVGGKPSSAWDWFVRVIRGILGLKQGQENALSQALDIGVGVMRENMGLNGDLQNGKVRGMADKDTVAGTQAPTSAGDGSTGSAGKWYGDESHVDEIQSLIDEGNFNYYGLRVMSMYRITDQQTNVKVGDVLEPSSIWDDGIPTDDVLDGTSAVGISDDPESIKRAIKESGFYSGKQVVVVGSNDRQFGEDQGEVILPDAVVVAVWNRKEPGTREANFNPNEPSASAGSDAGIRYNAAPGKINQTDTEAFKKWFGDSKVVDSDGNPMLAYHGTGATDINEFKVSERGTYGGGIYLTPDLRGANDYAIYRGAPSSTVYPVYVSIKNPASGSEAAQVASWKGEENAREELIRRGFDGVVDMRSGEIVAFYPEQIKSAIGNNGDFDGSNPDIRYNVADEGWSITEPSKIDDVIYALQDKQIDMKRVMQSIMKTGKKIKDSLNPYLQEELFHGRAAKGVKDFLDFELRPLLKQMQDANVDMGDFEEYLWNRHAEERNKQIAKINPEMQDGGSGIETAKARAYLAGLTTEQRKTFEALAGKVDAMNKASQKVLVESGLENQETIDAWNGAYRNYVPLQREDVDSGHVGTGKGFSVRGSSTKRALGSGRKVVDIIANLTMQRERNIVRAEKNRVTLAVRGLAMDNPNADFWTVDEAPKERVIENKAIYTVMDSEGRANEFTRMADAEKFARSVPGANIEQTWQDRVTERVVPGFSSRDNVLLARVNGEDKYVIFNERDERAMRMATAMKNLDMDNLGRVLSLVGKATRYLSAINTQYNPVFGVINLIRDAQSALINLSSTPLAGEQKRVLGYTKDALVGIYKDIRAHRAGKVPSSKWAALFEEFQKEGGQTGYRDQYANAEARAESIVSELAQFKEGKARQLTRGVFGWLSDYNETMENATRLAAYKAAKEKGMSNQQAASLAKNITVNFNRKGQMATQVGALYAFFNASVQGTARIAETLFDMKDGDIRAARLSKTGKKIVYGGIMLGSMQALLLAAAGFDDDEPPEFIRERNLILPIGDGKYLTLAMPLGFHVIPGIGRIATEFVLSGGKDPLKKLAAFGSMFADSFNPIGSAGWSLQTITPSVVDPFAALAENKDFTGKEIYRKDFNALNPTPGHERAKDVATVWSRYISEALNFMTGGTEFKPGLISPSPDAIDYLIGQVTGGVGREGNKIAQTVGATLSGEDLPLYKIPLAGRFVGDTEGQSGQSAKFYDAIKQINMHEAQYKGLLNDGRRQEATEYLAENPAVRFIMAGNHAELAVRKLRTMKRDLVEKEAGTDQIRAIDERITATMKAFNERAATAF